MESRFTGMFCFLFAITNRIIFASLYSIIGVDTKLQLSYTKNLLAGKGLGITKYFTSDLNTPIFDTYQVCPPGFSFAIIPFLKVFGGDEHKAVLAYDIVVAILFVFAVRLLGKRAGLSPLFNNIITLIAGCSQYIFFMAWSTTDAICVCLTLFAITATVGTINKKENISWLKVIGIGLLFSSSFYFRYMYLPIALLLPFLILLPGFLLKNKNLKTVGVKTLGAAAFFVILLIAFSLSVSGNAFHVTGVERGFFPDQFAECYPFLPASFINIDFGAQLVQRVSGMDYSRVIFYLQIINPLILALLIFLLWRYITINTHKKNFQFSGHALFIIIGSFVSLTVIFLLSYLTLTYKELSWGYHRWTFVGENRYFAFIYVFVPVAIFIALYHYRPFFNKPVIWLLAFIGLTCVGIEVIHGIYYNGKILVSHKDLAYIRDSDNGIRQFPAFIAEIKKQHPDREVLVSSKDQLYLHTASEMGYKAIFDYNNFLKTDLKVSSKSILIMPINTADVVIVNEFIEKKKLQLVKTISGISFYTQEIDP